jgi:triosephosphate isomerase
MNRPPLIIANWKMHKTRHQAQEFIHYLKSQRSLDLSGVYIAAPFTALDSCATMKLSNLVIGAQNVSEHTFGAYTGEVCAEMLKDLQVSFCLIGHSERRTYFHETSEQIHQKILRCLEANIQPILCIGETLQQHHNNQTNDVLFSQISSALAKLSAQDVSQISLAYEPVWAIGSGFAASPDAVQNIHADCRAYIQRIWGKACSDQLRILYGGSVNLQTLAEIISQKDVDGVLVGGASLDAHMFANIIKISRELKS